MKETLLLYRIHDKQLTWNGGKQGRSHWNKFRNELLDKYIVENKTANLINQVNN